MRLQKYAYLFLILLLLSPFIHPVYDNDFWWHLKTGEEIYKTKSLPEKDILSFTTYEDSPPPSTERIEFILKTYYISQLLYYILWKSIGPSGIIILRLLIFSIIFVLIYKKLREDGIGSFISLMIMVFMGSILVRFSSDRPQLFSYMFTTIYIFLLESMKGGKRWYHYLTPFITLIWANMHGTALMALPIGCIYLFQEVIKRNRDLKDIIIIIMSLLIIYLNPQNFKAISLFFNIFGTSHVEFNAEYLSPISQARLLSEFYPQYWIMVITTPFMLISKDLGLTGRLLILFQMIISLYSTRFMPFFLITWTLFSGSLSKEYILRSLYLKTTISIASIIFMLSTIFIYRDEVLKTGIKEENFPVKAVLYMKENSINGRLFNWYEWGGYIEWNLPEVKTFIDSRALRLDIFDDYIKSLYREDSDIIERYKIDIILLPLLNPIDGIPLSIIYKILKDNKWSPVYIEKNSVLFVKGVDGRLKREDVLNAMIKNLLIWCDNEPSNPLRWKNLGRAYYEMGLKKDALNSYQKSYELNPHDLFTKQMIYLLRD